MNSKRSNLESTFANCISNRRSIFANCVSTRRSMSRIRSLPSPMSLLRSSIPCLCSSSNVSILSTRETNELAGVKMSNEALLTLPIEDLDRCCGSVPWWSSLKLASSLELVGRNLKCPILSLETIAKEIKVILASPTEWFKRNVGWRLRKVWWPFLRLETIARESQWFSGNQDLSTEDEVNCSWERGVIKWFDPASWAVGLHSNQQQRMGKEANRWYGFDLEGK